MVEVRPAASGRGVEVKLAVRKNVSAHAEDDFLQCVPGDVVELMASDAPKCRLATPCARRRSCSPGLEAAERSCNRPGASDTSEVRS